MATILVVDDRPTNRQFLLTLLGYTGHRVLEAGDGAAALDVARAERPDLVITDILMPIMDGYEFAFNVRADPDLAKTPIVFYSATYSSPEARLLADSCGVRTVLRKPAEPQEVLDVVNAELGVTEAQRPALPAAPGGAAVPKPQRAGDQAGEYLDDLRLTRAMLDGVLSDPRGPIADPGRAHEISEKLSAHIANLQQLTSRLATLTEIMMDMLSVREPARMVEKFFSAACQMIPSDCAAVGVFDETERGLKHLFTRGIDPAIYDWGARIGRPASLAREHGFLRLDESESESKAFPAGHPPMRSFLGGPVVHADQTHGWIYFANSDAGKPFSEEDERVAGTLGSMLALLYEHATLYDTVQRHSARLQIEMVARKRAAEELRESERRFSDMMGRVELISLMVDREARITYCNDYLLRLTGWKREEVVGRNGFELLVPPDQTGTKGVFQDLLADLPQAWHHESEILTKSGARRLIRWNNSVLRSVSGEVIGTASIGEDITEQKQSETRIRSLNRVYAVLSGINALIVRAKTREELFRGACRIAVDAGDFVIAWIGMEDREARKVTPVASAGDVRDFFDSAPLARAHASPRGKAMAWRVIGEKKPVVSHDVRNDPQTLMKKQCADRGINSLAILPLVVGDEGVGVLSLYAKEPGFFDDEEMKLLLELAGDISFALDHIGKEEKLDYLAYYDALTGLANGALFRERLGQSVLDAGQARRKAAVLLIDVDRFKTINDSLGRHAGDEILRQIGKRMLRYCGDPGRLARIGADRFAMVMPDVATEQEVARRIEEKMKGCFGEPFRIDDTELRIAARIGIALFPNDGADAETLFRNAEAALKKAKAGGERYLFYTQQMTERIAERLALESKLRQALERDEFVLHYQPKFDTQTRRVAGVEALIRWQSPELGLVPPMQFIPLLEETGLIFEVGAWALRRAAFDHRRWRKLGLAAPRVAVNVSAFQLRRRDFVESVRNVLGEGEGAAAIDLELTESLVMEDVRGSTEKLEALLLLGVQIAIDDFGTGYSSLAYLAKLPVNELKIDRSFITAMLKDSHIMTLVSTIVSLAHSLKLRVVAEGVETEEQADALKRLGSDQLQGYLLGRPVPFEEISALLGSSTGKPRGGGGKRGANAS